MKLDKIDRGILKRFKYFFLACFLTILSSSVMADGVFDTLIEQYHQNTSTWYTTFFNLGKNIFWGLALIEFAWSTIVWALEGKDVSQIIFELCKKAMTIGFFWYLFENASTFVPAIIDTFKLAGQRATGLGDISPSKVYDLGVYNGTSIMHSATISITDLATTLFAKFVAFFIGLFVILCYIVMAGQLTITIIESFIAQYMGILFLGFASSRWTSDYAQKYLAYCVSTGVKLMMCYLIIGLGTASVADVANQLATITDAENALDVYLTIFANSAILCFLSWFIPNLASSMLNGSPSMTLGSALATAGTMTASAIGAGAMMTKTAMAGGAGVAGVASAVKAGTELASVQNPNASAMANSLSGIGHALAETGSHLKDGFNGVLANNTTGGKVADRLNARTQTAKETQEAGGTYTPPPTNPAPSSDKSNTNNTNNKATDQAKTDTKATPKAETAKAENKEPMASTASTGTASNVDNTAPDAELTSANAEQVAPPTEQSTTAQATEPVKAEVKPAQVEAKQDTAPVQAPGTATDTAKQTAQATTASADATVRGSNAVTSPTSAPTAPTAQTEGKDHYQNVMEKLDKLQKIQAPNLPQDASSGGSIDIKLNH